jgi:DNA-binding MarR family transcriptional regulator
LSGADPRLILSDEGLDASLEAFLLAEAALWGAADGGLVDEPHGLGRGHWRAAVLMKRRPGLGVQALSRLTGLSKQGASRILRDLEAAGYAERSRGEEDARRRPSVLTDAGRAFEARASERARAHLARAYRTAGLDAVTGARRVLQAVAAAPLSSEEGR